MKRAKQRKEASSGNLEAIDCHSKSRPKVSITAMNTKQKEYLRSLYSAPCVVGEGPAGVGKTYLAASVAAQDLAERRIQKIILSRANVPTGKSLGAFPGSVEEKMAPWLLPITDVLRKHLGDGFYEYAVKTGVIQVQPLETIRGRSYDNAIVLMDESQQLTIAELKAVSTRMGTNSRLFLMGDSAQRDVRVDGLEWFKALVKKHELPIDCHRFTSDDCVRGDLCSALVKAFEAEG